MASAFDRFDAANQAAMAAMFGEPVRVRLFVAADPYNAAQASAPVEVQAIFSSAADISAVDYPRTDRGGAPKVTAPSEIWISAAHAGAAGLVIRAGDRVDVDGRSGVVQTYKVMTAEPDDHGAWRIVIAR